MMRAAGPRRFPHRLAALCLSLVLVPVVADLAAAQAPPPPPPPPRAELEAELRRREVVRDSLRVEIERYAELIEQLKESVAEVDSVDDPRRETYRELERSAAAISEAIGAVAAQLSELELEVDEGQISLSDGHGGRVTVEIPEDLGERLGKGLGDITRVLLDEMPDTLRIGSLERGFRFDRRDDRVDVAPVPPAPRKVIEGGMVKLRDDLEVSADEVVLGDVVAIMGDALVEGHVRGDLVVVLGDVTLGETAEVDGEVVAVLGRFERAEGARIGSLTVINPGRDYLPPALTGRAGDWIGFWGWQALFLLLALLVLILVALVPRQRLDRVVAVLEDRSLESFGVGLLMAVVGHLVLVGLAGILVLTVIGIPVAILLIMAVALIDLLAVGVASLVVGRRLCGRAGLACGHVWREVLLGMVVLHAPAFLAALLGAVGLPLVLVLLFSWFSRLVKFLAFCFGLGALVLGRFGNARTVAAPAPGLDPVVESPGA